MFKKMVSKSKNIVSQIQHGFTFVVLSLALAVLFGISNPGIGISAGIPPGFTCLGSVLPDDMGMLREVPKLIEQYKLAERDYSEIKAKERWGIEVTSPDQERGYIVFSRSYLDDIYYFSVPNNRIDKLSIFASPDEYEPITFAVYGLKDIKGFKVSVSDLKDDKGNIIRKDNIDIRTVRSLPFIMNEKEYDLEPLLLEKRPAVDISAKKSAWFWLTAYVPKNGKPGTYAGTISLTAPQAKPCELKLSVKVLPIQLQEPDVLNGMCFLIPGREYLHPKNLSKYFADMQAHGMNSMWTWPDFEVKKVDGKLVCDFSKFGVTRKELNYFGNSLDEMLSGYLKAGFNKLWIAGSADTFGGMIEQATGAKQMTPEFDQAYVELARQFAAHAREKNWPPFAWHVIDEPNYNREGSVEYAIRYNKLLKDNFPDIKTFTDIGPWTKEDEPLFPYIDIMTYACQKKENIENCKKAGCEFWIYNHGGWGRFNKMDRMNRGIYVWKTGAKGNYDWGYTWWIEPQIPPSWHPAFVYVVPAPDGPLPTVGWEGVREGIDDLKYIYTLDRLIQKAKASGSEGLKTEAAKAEADLNDIMKDAPFEWEDRGTYLEKTPSANFDLNRWKVAQDIIRLDKVISGEPVPKMGNPLLPKDDSHTLGLWRFDEDAGDIVNDINPNRNNPGRFAQVTGNVNPQWVEGISGKALQFSTTTNPVFLPLKKGINPKGLTFEAWINYSEIRPEASYIGCGENWILRLRPGGVLNFVIGNKYKTGWQEMSSSKGIQPNQWHHVAATYNGEAMKIYVDGSLDSSFASKGEINITGADPSLIVGGSDALGKEGFFIGKIDEVRLSDVAREFSLPWN